MPAMPRKYFKRWMPSVEKVRSIRALGIFGNALFHPATGLFCGLIPGPLQMLGAGILAVLFRVNLPVALLATLFTNPITIVPLYLIAYQIGSLVLGAAGGPPPPPPPSFSFTALGESMRALAQWAASLGAPLALGVFLLACLLAAGGYAAVRLAWSAYLRRAWARRRSRRALGLPK
jgi:uncharacterized protein